MARQPRLPAPPAGVPRRRPRRARRRRRGRARREEPRAGPLRGVAAHRSGRTDQHPARQPQRPGQGGRDAGPQPPQRRAAPGARRAPQRRHAVDGRHPPVHGRRQPRRHPGPGRVPQRGVRADPVHADRPDDVRPTARRHPAADQQVLHLRPRARPQPHRAHGRRRRARTSRSAGATPPPPSATGTSTPTSPRARRRSRQPARSPAAPTPTWSGMCAGGDHHGVPARPPRRHRRGARQLGDVPGRRARHRPGVADRDARVEARRGGGPRRGRSAPATSTARTWRRCSPGCAPTTWCGTTGSTTTCWARTRPRSTSSTGTPTPPACRRGCTPTSSTCSISNGLAEGTLDGARHAGRSRQGRRSTPTSWPARPTTSSRGRRPTGPPSCSAATREFVLSSSGHIQAIVNPPGNPKSSYRTGDGAPPADAERVARRCRDARGQLVGPLDGMARDPLRRATARHRRTLGSAAHPPLEPAPGRYVHLT